MDGDPKNRRFIVVPQIRYSVCDQETGAEVFHCGSESLADFWAQRLAQVTNEADEA